MSTNILYFTVFWGCFQHSTFVGSAWSFGFFIPATTANDAVHDWGLNPGPPALEASTIPLDYRGGGYFTVLFGIYIFAYSYNKQLLFQCNKVSKEYNAGHLLDKEARKWATKIAKENKMISDLQKQLKAIGTEDKVSVKLQTNFIYFFIFNDYKTIYTNHSRWHRCACLCALVAGNQRTWRKPTCPTW